MTRACWTQSFPSSKFENQSHADVKVVAAGTGRALELGRTGDADVVFAHAPTTERAYLRNGTYTARYEVMFDNFVLVGPASDPAAKRNASNVTDALRRIYTAGAIFVSRGDASGTHLKEQELWADAGFDYATEIAISGNGWYRSVGQGSAATLRVAAALQGYCLVSDSTFHVIQPAGLSVLRTNEPPLRNQYSVLLVNQTRVPNVKEGLANAFAEWMVSPATQQAIGAYQVGGYRPFTPDAGVVETG